MPWRRSVPAILDNLIWYILVGVFLFFVTQSDKFLTPANVRNILAAAAVLGVLVVGQTFVLITGNFDLSSESTLGLSALLGLWLVVRPWPQRGARGCSGTRSSQSSPSS
jgi:ribose/xylose/arabinose/galactoside ABC-type transport system permease subunit